MAAFESGLLASVFLDVFTQEPLPRDGPFRGLLNAIASPCSAAASGGLAERVTGLFRGNLGRWRRGGAPRNLVARDVAAAPRP